MASRFLFNEALWDELAGRIPSAKSVRVAVAYLGSGANGLLPLRKGDTLLVDMSLRTVRAGATDPREVETYLKRGVKVFSRGSLHAKFFVIDRTVIAGSSNISKHAKHHLDEAAILTDDPATTRRATATFDQLCTEPVGKEYLAKCLQEYRPPKFSGGPAPVGATRSKLRHGKVWLVAGMTYRDVPRSEAPFVERALAKAGKDLRDYERFEVDCTRHPSKPKFFDDLRVGDWLVICTEHGGGFDVSPPARFLGVRSYARGTGKRRYLLMYEAPQDADTVRWAKLRRSLPESLSMGSATKPRTMPVRSDADADAILRLWDHARFKGKKR